MASPDLRLALKLAEWEDLGMRYQDPPIERVGRRRKHYEIRPYVRVVRDGRVITVRRRIRLGFCDEITLREARRRKQEIMATINAGDVSVASQLTLANVIERFCAAHLPLLAATTRAKYEAHLRNHILPDLGRLRLGEIDRSIIAEWLISKKRLSKATRLDLRNLLAAIFRCATEWRMWVGENPAHRAPVGRGGIHGREFSRPTDEQVLRWLDEIRDTVIMPAWKARQLAELCLIAGLRVSEALGLRWKDIDQVRRTVRIERRYARGDIDQPKSATSRRERYIGPLAEEILFRRSEGSSPDDPVFARADGRIPDDRDLQQHVWRPAAERAGIYHPGFGLHSLRRLSITWRQECGATLVEAMRQAGHTRPAMTARYTLEDLRREVQIVERLRQRLKGEWDKTGHDFEAGGAKLLQGWWARGDSNARPLPCQGSADQSITDACVENKGHTVIASGTKRDKKRRNWDETGRGACDFCGALCCPRPNGALICDQCRGGPTRGGREARRGGQMKRGTREHRASVGEREEQVQ